MAAGDTKPKGRAGLGKSGVSDSLKRALRMIRMLDQSKGLSAPEIEIRLAAEGFPTDAKRVRATLRDIQDSGIGIWEDTTDRTLTNATRWKLKKGIQIGDVLRLSRSELFALYLARQSLEPLRHTKVYQEFIGAFDKIESVLGRPSHLALKELDGELFTHLGVGSLLNLDAAVIEAVHSACVEEHVLEIDYFSPDHGKVRKRKVGPQFMMFSQKGFYLYAEDLELPDSPTRHTPKNFSIPRMKSATMLEIPYASKQAEYKELAAGRLGVALGAEGVEPVVLDFQPGSPSAYVRERFWHHSEVKTPLPNGGLRLTLHVTIDPTLIKWILGFESAALVKSPASLRDQIADSARAIAKLYTPQKKDAA